MELKKIFIRADAEKTGYTVTIQYTGIMPKETEVLLASFGFTEGKAKCFTPIEALKIAKRAARVLMEQSDTFVVEGKTK